MSPQRTCVTCPTTAIFTHSGPACAIQKLRVTSMHRSHLRRPTFDDLVFFFVCFTVLFSGSMHTNPVSVMDEHKNSSKDVQSSHDAQSLNKGQAWYMKKGWQCQHVSHVSHVIRACGINGEKMYSVTNTRYFCRHGCMMMTSLSAEM